MTNLTLDTLIRQHPDQIAAEADGEVLMMHIESGNYFGLNEVASFIWNQLDEPRSIAELCAAIQTEFEVDETRCQADAMDFLQGMIDDGLAQLVETASNP
ncbi:MAG: PqqD family protein [Chromatiaceae bacterium]|nr:PqqD family protein [Chromatiaceae bacterium]